MKELPLYVVIMAVLVAVFGRLAVMGWHGVTTATALTDVLIFTLVGMASTVLGLICVYGLIALIVWAWDERR